MTLSLDAVALSKVIYNIANSGSSSSDSTISQTAFVGALFLLSAYRAQLFFIRTTNASKNGGHGFEFLLMKNFITVGDSSGESARLIV